MADRHHLPILALVGAGGDRLGEIGRVADLGDDVRRDRDDGDRHRAREIADRGDAEAGRLKRGVELPVFHQLDRLAERQILDRHHVVGETGGLKYPARVDLGARPRRADGDALALEIGERLDAGVLGGDDLDVVRINRRDGAEFVELRGEAHVRLALPGEAHGIGERKCDLAATGLQQVEVLDGSLGRLHRDLGVRKRLAVDGGECVAERVIDAAGAAGQDIDGLRRATALVAVSAIRGNGRTAPPDSASRQSGRLPPLSLMNARNSSKEFFRAMS